jgi:hypothetical protein
VPASESGYGVIMNKKKTDIDKINGFTLIELLIVFAFFIICVIQIKIISVDLFKDFGLKDYSFSFFSITLFLSFLLTFIIISILIFSFDLIERKEIFFKFLSIILVFISFLSVSYCMYHLRDSIFFIIFNAIFLLIHLGMLREMIFTKKNLKNKRK